MPGVELEDVGDRLDGELVEGVGLLEVTGLGVSQGGQDLARSIRVVDEGGPSLERVQDGSTAQDVSDGFLRRVPLDPVDAVADDVVGAEPLTRAPVLAFVMNPRNAMRPVLDVGDDRVDRVAVATLRILGPRGDAADEPARLQARRSSTGLWIREKTSSSSILTEWRRILPDRISTSLETPTAPARAHHLYRQEDRAP